MTLVKFNSDERNNGSSLPGFSDVFDSILSDTFFSDSLTPRVPAANISETEDHFHVELAAPGLKKENFKLNLDRDALNISVGQHPEDYNQQKNYSKREYSYVS
ncbi:HSP20 family molecular chaperone IbpA [Mucilaginibacter sp. SG564]|nr:HSP20 family molecular chaperone IbpA [Mucilaginibacter sp. SG564]